MKTKFPLLKTILSAVCLFVLYSCDWVTLTEEDCSSDLYIQLQYTYNLNEQDRTAAQVEDAYVYVFNESETLDNQYYFCKDTLVANNYIVRLPNVTRGYRKIVVWSGSHSDHFIVPDMREGIDKLSDIGLTFRQNNALSDKELNNLFYSEKDVEVGGSRQVETISLIKDTNIFNIHIVSFVGKDISDELYDVEIVAVNGIMNGRNNIITRDSTHYVPYGRGTESIPYLNYNAKGARYNISMLRFVLREYSYYADTNLIVKNRKGEILKVYSLSGAYRQFSQYISSINHWAEGQEYYDRRDSYTVTCVVDANGRFMDSLEVGPMVNHDDYIEF